MSEHPQRPDDHLVEPLFAAFSGAESEPPRARRGTHWVLWIVLLALAAGAAWWLLR